MESGKKVEINTDQCKKIGAVLKNVDVRPAFYKREFLSFEADRETKLRIYFISAAICHQTHDLFHPTLNLWGWDYMEYAFLQMYKTRHPFINPGYVSICNAGDISGYLKTAFSPDGKPENCTLDRIEERAKTLLEICCSVRENNNRSISDLIDSCEGKLLNDGKGLYEVLPRFTAFSDPFRKKISFFLKLATDAGLIRIKDPHNYIPIMDYHIQRVLLRNGCVEILDPGIKSRIENREDMPADNPVRESCIESIRLIAETSGHAILKMNDFFWPLGRSCCNITTLCTSKMCIKDPCSLFQIINIPSHDKCLLQHACKGSRDENYRVLWEPIVNTYYY
ncbi:MAG: hypothetical protein FJY07_00475 [Bacteroidetes bacterium]|nr:hypothetical protein [Bacteroidota bacterium]